MLETESGLQPAKEKARYAGLFYWPSRPDSSRPPRAAEAYCGSHVPESARDQLRIACSRRGNSITIVEERPPWKPEAQDSGWTSTKVARLRYDDATGRWSLHCSDSNGRWWPYDEIAPTSKVDPLLAEVGRDPTGIFWG